MAAYIYNCSSSLKHYAKYNERNLGPLKVLHESFCIIRWFLRVLPTDYRYITLKSGDDFFLAAGSDKQRKLGDGSKTRRTRLLLICIIRWFLRVLPTDYRYIPLKSGDDFFQAAGSDKQRKLGDGSKTRHTRLLLPPPSPHSPRFPPPPCCETGHKIIVLLSPVKVNLFTSVHWSPFFPSLLLKIINIFFLSFSIQGRSVVRVCESLSKLHEYISPGELMLPSSTLTLEEDLKVINCFVS